VTSEAGSRGVAPSSGLIRTPCARRCHGMRQTAVLRSFSRPIRQYGGNGGHHVSAGVRAHKMHYTCLFLPSTASAAAGPCASGQITSDFRAPRASSICRASRPLARTLRSVKHAALPVWVCEPTVCRDVLVRETALPGSDGVRQSCTEGECSWSCCLGSLLDASIWTS
jgi:hypothetical protein